MLFKLLVNAPSGEQEIVEVEESGGYFDAQRVLWDERSDGPMPEVQLGGMVRAGNELAVDDQMLAQALARPPATPSQVTYRQGMAVLIKHGLDAQIDAALNAQLTAAQQSGDDKSILAAKLAMNDWKHSTAFQRDWPLIAQMQRAFGWSDALVDALFVEAATL